MTVLLSTGRRVEFEDSVEIGVVRKLPVVCYRRCVGAGVRFCLFSLISDSDSVANRFMFSVADDNRTEAKSIFLRAESDNKQKHYFWKTARDRVLTNRRSQNASIWIHWSLS